MLCRVPRRPSPRFGHPVVRPVVPRRPVLSSQPLLRHVSSSTTIYGNPTLGDRRSLHTLRHSDMSFHNHTRHQTRKVLTVATSLSVTTSACTAAAARAHDAPRLGAFGPLPSAAAVSSVSPRPAASSCCRSAPPALCSVRRARRGPPTPSLLERAQSSSKRPGDAREVTRSDPR